MAGGRTGRNGTGQDGTGHDGTGRGCPSTRRRKPLLRQLRPPYAGAAVPDRGPAPPGAPRPSSSSAPPHPRGRAEPLPPVPPPWGSPAPSRGRERRRRGRAAQSGWEASEVLSRCIRSPERGTGNSSPPARRLCPFSVGSGLWAGCDNRKGWRIGGGNRQSSLPLPCSCRWRNNEGMGLLT